MDPSVESVGNNPALLCRFALLPPIVDEDGSCECAWCGESYHRKIGHDPTRFCHGCAHEVVKRLAMALVPLTPSVPPSIDEVLDDAFRAALGAAGGNYSRAARLLGIDRRSIYRWAARAGYVRPGPAPRGGRPAGRLAKPTNGGA